MTDTPFDIDQAHHWFAVECNNAAWELVDQADRSTDEGQRMVDLAHAAAHHWKQVGQPIHDVRALNLLAMVYQRIGQRERALHYAEAAHQKLMAIDDGTPFDRASTRAMLGLALDTAGRDGTAHRNDAMQIAEQLDAEERAVFDQLYRN